MSVKELKKLLARAGLPKNYHRLSESDQRAVRMKVLASWYDPTKPNVLISDLVKFRQAFFLWVEFYYKPSPINHGIYYYDDPASKYDMVDLVFGPPADPEEPSKAVLKATRRLGKTQTLIVEAVPFLCINRPFTRCLISEVNDSRTGEEMTKVKQQVEQNERIHEDFGGKKELWKADNEEKWSQHTLQFSHLPGCEVVGASVWSAQRGRGFIYAVIDDPEDEKESASREWRVRFFTRLFGAICPMVEPGGHIVWIGTPTDTGEGRSCLSIAFEGMTEGGPASQGLSSDLPPSIDPRMADWKKGRFTVVRRNEAGEWESVQPERMSRDRFLRKLERDPITTRKEVLCEAVTPGTRAFVIDSARHGFMHCWDEATHQEYFLDLFTGERLPWRTFLNQSSIAGAGDIADGQSAECDPGACVWIAVRSPGMDERQPGVVYVLDVWNQRCLCEKQVEMAYLISEVWRCHVFGWERTGLLGIINRHIHRYRDRLLREGKDPPIFKEISVAGRRKVPRILGLTTLFSNNEIRLLRMEPFTDADGVTHIPVDFERAAHYRMLINQLTEYTDQGIADNDDCADALELAVQTAGKRKGEPEDEQPAHGSDVMVEKWDKAGFHIDPIMVPPEARSPKMETELERRAMIPALIPGDDLYE